MKKNFEIIVLSFLAPNFIYAHHGGFIQHSWAMPALIIGLISAAYFGWFYYKIQKMRPLKGMWEQLEFAVPALLAVFSWLVVSACAIILYALYFWPYGVIILVIWFGVSIGFYLLKKK